MKELYPPVGVAGRRGEVADRNGGYALPPYPDGIGEPGSEHRIAVMQARIRRGEALFHPADLKHETPAAGWNPPEVEQPFARNMLPFDLDNNQLGAGGDHDDGCEYGGHASLPKRTR